MQLVAPSWGRSIKDRCLFYLSGQEDEKQLTKPLKALAQRRRRMHTVVLYARRADHRKIGSGPLEIEAQRTALGLTQTQLASAIGVSE
jgi:hypothetical protein